MKLRRTSAKRIYLKWPWNVIVSILLAAALRIFAIPLILLIMWWNKKQQPDGPEEGYCLQRTRSRLIGLVPAALLAVGGGLAACLYEIWIVDDRRNYQITTLRSSRSWNRPWTACAAVLLLRPLGNTTPGSTTT